MSRSGFVAVTLAVFSAGFAAGHWLDVDHEAQAQGRGKVFELRTYTSPDGRLNDLVARFRNDTLRIFEKHGMHNVGYWLPTDAPAASNTWSISSRTTAATLPPRAGRRSVRIRSGKPSRSERRRMGRS
jgi:hypothetical protein